MIAALAVSACLIAAEDSDKGLLSRTVFDQAKGVTVDIFGPVYPFDALLKEKAGKVTLECLVDGESKLISTEVKESSGPEFTGAAIAYAEAVDFTMGGGLKSPGKEMRILTQELVFDVGLCDRPIKQPSCPSKSAMEILEKLRTDPTGKQFARVKHLDGALVPLKQKAPVFPKALQDKAGAGEAVVDFYIDQQGFAVLPRIVSASDPAFGYAACQSIDTWSFQPPLREGKPTVVKVRIPVNFRLKAQLPETPAQAK